MDKPPGVVHAQGASGAATFTDLGTDNAIAKSDRERFPVICSSSCFRARFKRKLVMPCNV